jgi:hypothetical protein
MKMVEAIVKPFKLEEIKEALTKSGVQGMKKLKVSAAKKVIPNSTEAPSTAWTFYLKLGCKSLCLMTTQRRSLN